MTERGYRWLDTGSGPGTMVPRLSMQEGERQEAYRRFVSHALTCEACEESGARCPEAIELWDAYKALCPF